MQQQMPVEICCFGNPLHGDDGLGLYVYKKLQECGCFTQEHLHFFADVPLNALTVFEQGNPVILIDAIKNFGPAGSIHCLSEQDVSKPELALCSHMNSIPHLIQSARCLFSNMPEVELWGVTSDGIDTYSQDLSDPVKDGAEYLVSVIMKKHPQGFSYVR